MEKHKNPIIAIDGHSSCGKSTLAKQLAKHFNYLYIDTGAMYRAVTLFCMQNNLIDNNKVKQEELKKRIGEVNISFTFDEQTKTHKTCLNGKVVEQEIRKMEVSDKVSYVSEIGFVRDKMTDLQRKIGNEGGVVMDGRDIGTAVFPNAEVKIFMTASAQIRAQRRYDELKDKNPNLLFDEVLKNVEKRDFIDQNRDIAPLKQADDAFVVDNSNLTREEQLQKVIEIVNNRLS